MSRPQGQECRRSCPNQLSTVSWRGCRGDAWSLATCSSWESWPRGNENGRALSLIGSSRWESRPCTSPGPGGGGTGEPALRARVIRALVPLGVMPFPPLSLPPVVVDRARPVPSLAVALWRAVPTPHLGNTVEMVLKIRVSQPHSLRV